MYEFVAQYSETARKEFLTVAIASVLIQDYFNFLIEEKLPIVFNLNDSFTALLKVRLSREFFVV